MKILLSKSNLKSILDNAFTNYSNVVSITNNAVDLKNILHKLLGINIDNQEHEKIDNLVFFAHLNEYRLYISLKDNTRVTLINKERFEFDVDGKYFFYELDGWSQIIFLPLLSYFFLREYFKNKIKKASPQKSDLDRKAYGKIVLDELWRVVNAFRIKSKCESAINSKINDELTGVLTNFVSDLDELKSNEPESAVEIIFPGGLSKSHAIYLSFTLDLEHQSYFNVIYNTGLLSGRHYSETKNNEKIIYPYPVGTINGNKLSFINYLRRVCENSYLIYDNLSSDQQKEMLDKTYNAGDINNILTDSYKCFLNSSIKYKPDVSGFTMANKGDCVTRNYLASIYCRYSDVSRKANEVFNSNENIYDLIFNRLIKFPISNVITPDNIKYKSPLKIRLEERSNKFKKHVINNNLSNFNSGLRDSEGNDSDRTEESAKDSNKINIELFEGRDCVIRFNEMRRLAFLLNKQNENLKRLAVYAPQGGGKTTFLRMFCHKKYSPLINISEYERKELNAESRGQFLTACSSIINDVSSQNIKLVLETIAKTYKETNKKAFFIFDNVNNKNDVDFIIDCISDLSLNGLKGYVIIATQIQEFFRNPALDYDLIFSLEDASQLVLHIIGNQDNPDVILQARELVKELEYNPLYINKVANTIRHQDMSFAAGISHINFMVQEFIKRSLMLKTDKSGDKENMRNTKEDFYCGAFISSILKLLNIEHLSYEKELKLNLDKNNELALLILYFCSYLDPTEIKCEVIHGIMNEIFKAHPKLIKDSKNRISFALEELANLQFINITDGKIIIHRMTQVKVKSFVNTINIYVNNNKVNNEYCLSAFSKLFVDNQDCQGIIFNAKYIAHIYYIIFTVHHEYQSLAKDDLELLIGIAATAADHYVRISRFAIAMDIIKYYSVMLEYLEREYPPLSSRGYLKKASLYVQRGWIGNLLKEDLAENLMFLKEACEIRRREFPDKDKNLYTIRAHIQYVLCLLYNNKLADAKNVIDSLDELYREAPKDPAKIGVYGQYLYIKAYYEIKNKNYGPALTLLNTALQLYKPNESFFRIQILNAHGIIAFNKMQYVKAKEYFTIASNETKAFNNQGIHIYIGEDLRTQFWMAKTELELGNAIVAFEIMTHVIEIQQKIYKPESTNIRNASELRNKISKLMPFNQRPIREELKYDDDDVANVLSAYFKISMGVTPNQDGEYLCSIKDVTYKQAEYLIYINKNIYDLKNRAFVKKVSDLFKSYKSNTKKNYKCFIIAKYASDHNIDCYLSIQLYSDVNGNNIKISISEAVLYDQRVESKKKLRLHLNALENQVRDFLIEHERSIRLKQSGIIVLNSIFHAIERCGTSIDDRVLNVSNNNQPELILKIHLGLILRAAIPNEKKFLAKHTLKPINISNIILKENGAENKRFLSFIHFHLQEKRLCILPHKTIISKYVNIKLNDLYSYYIKQFEQEYTVTYRFDCGDELNLIDQLKAFISLLNHPINSIDGQSSFSSYLAHIADGIEKLDSCLLIFNYINNERMYLELQHMLLARLANKNNKIHIILTFTDKSVSAQYNNININEFNSEKIMSLVNTMDIQGENKLELLDLTENNPYMLMLIQHTLLACEDTRLDVLLKIIQIKKNELLKANITSERLNSLALFDVILGFVDNKKLLNELSYIVMLLAAYTYNTIPLDLFSRFDLNKEGVNSLELVKQLEKINLIDLLYINKVTYINISPFICELISDYFRYLCTNSNNTILMKVLNLINERRNAFDIINDSHIYFKLVEMLNDKILLIPNDDNYIKYFYLNCISVLKSLDRLNLMCDDSQNEMKKSVETLVIWLIKYLVGTGSINEAKKWLLKIKSVKTYIDEIRKLPLNHDLIRVILEDKSTSYGESWVNIEEYLIIISKVFSLTFEIDIAEKVLLTAYSHYLNKNNMSKLTEVVIEICNVLRRTGRLNDPELKKIGTNYSLIELLQKRRRLTNIGEDIKLSLESNIGILYFYIGKVSDALPYLNMVKFKFDEFKNIVGLAYINSYIGNCYLAQGKLKPAVQELENAVDLLRERNLLSSFYGIWISCSLAFSYALSGDSEQSIKISNKIINLIKQNSYNYPILKIIAMFCSIYSSLQEAIEDNLIYDIAEFSHMYNLILDEYEKIGCDEVSKLAYATRENFHTLSHKDKICNIYMFMKNFFAVTGTNSHPFSFIMGKLWTYFYEKISVNNGGDSNLVTIVDNSSFRDYRNFIMISLESQYNKPTSVNNTVSSISGQSQPTTHAMQQSNTLPITIPNISQTLNPIDKDAILSQLLRITHVKWTANISRVFYYASDDLNLIRKISQYLSTFHDDVSCIRGVVQIRNVKLHKLCIMKEMEQTNNLQEVLKM